MSWGHLDTEAEQPICGWLLWPLRSQCWNGSWNLRMGLPFPWHGWGSWGPMEVHPGPLIALVAGLGLHARDCLALGLFCSETHSKHCKCPSYELSRTLGKSCLLHKYRCCECSGQVWSPEWRDVTQYLGVAEEVSLSQRSLRDDSVLWGREVIQVWIVAKKKTKIESIEKHEKQYHAKIPWPLLSSFFFFLSYFLLKQLYWHIFHKP